VSTTYRMPDGSTRTTHVDVSSWIPDETVLDEVPPRDRLSRAIDLAELAEALQTAAHCADTTAIRECCQSDCWVTHLDEATATSVIGPVPPRRARR
jgi:hypothetical protein